jgi:sn-glycerol 3-phosphate transport system ATP-binding protein
VFQNYALYPHMSVFDNMAFGLQMRGYAKEETTKRVKEAAEILGIEALLERKPRQLSGGQRQRVAVGRAIVRHPQVFLFDEPLSNLDAKLRVQMRSEIKALHRRLGTTSLYVTHDQVEAMTLAHRMIVMNAGRAEQIGAPLEVYEKPATTFVASFIGSPPMNLIPQARAGKPVIFGIRPEHLEPCGEAEAQLVADIDLIEPLGADTLVHGHVPQGTRIAVRLPASFEARAGKLPLRYQPRQAHDFDAETGALGLYGFMEGEEMQPGVADLDPEVIAMVEETLAQMLAGEFTRFDVFTGPINDNQGKTVRGPTELLVFTKR